MAILESKLKKKDPKLILIFFFLVQQFFFFLRDSSTTFRVRDSNLWPLDREYMSIIVELCWLWQVNFNLFPLQLCLSWRQENHDLICYGTWMCDSFSNFLSLFIIFLKFIFAMNSSISFFHFNFSNEYCYSSTKWENNNYFHLLSKNK